MTETPAVYPQTFDYYNFCVIGNYAFEYEKPVISSSYEYEENGVYYCTTETEKGVYWYMYCLNNPLMLKDPSGNRFIRNDNDDWVEDPKNPDKGVYWDNNIRSKEDADNAGLIYRGKTVNGADAAGNVWYGAQDGRWYHDAPLKGVTVTAKRENSVIQSIYRGQHEFMTSPVTQGVIGALLFFTPVSSEAVGAKMVGSRGTTIVGEGMKRVSMEAAKHQGSVTLTNMPKFVGTDYQITSQMMTHNRQWILQQMRNSKTIIDIGVDPMRSTPSIFYQMEQNMMNNYLNLYPNAFQIIKP
jgi:hypothetical protein